MSMKLHKFPTLQISITEAAKLLFISQPSLSNSIKETEKEAGITIFLRSRTGITLTKDGANACTISSGIFPKYLNGENIIFVPLAENETMHIGYVLNENQELSELGKSYLEELRKYAPANP